MKTAKFLLIASVLLAAPSVLSAQQPTMRIEPPHLEGPRELKNETAEAVVRDYLQSWQDMRAAFGQNRADLLRPDFVGTAADKLAATIRQQAAIGIQTHYRDLSHDIQIVLYTPEGLSVQLIDNVVYDEQIVEQGKILTTQRIHARYIAVLTPAELRWRVRLFQATPK